MISKLRYYASSLLLVALIAAPGAAQPLDGGNETTSRPEVQNGAPQDEASTEPSSQEPPSWIARRPFDAAARPKASAATERGPLLVLSLWLLAVGLVLFIAERARSWITKNIPLRSALGALVFVLRIAVFSLLVAIVFAVVPSDQNWILGTLAVLALVVGWSVRDLFADLVAGAILAAERRVKKGMWVSGDGFQGTVEGRSLRATWLRDGQGHRITVP
ncbi:MAG: mechanosensitive ion channel family protein, partial [Deltaproteobacteria bacterium]|nr:mechanosensitive ion channel family protein [Deltaproteobacteria bacterium]